MTLTKIVKQDDLANLLEFTFEYNTNLGDLDIPTSTPCVMHIVNMDTGVAMTEAGTTTITSNVGGVVTVLYEWGLGDTAVPGRYRMELRLTTTDGPLTMPTVAYNNLLILPKLG